ncbi:hypothetical protein [Streptomyces sp. NPDC054786]
MKLRIEVNAHVDDEENNLFPPMRNNVDAAFLDGLGDKIRQTKKTASIRPHPAAPSTPTGQQGLAPALGLVGRVHAVPRQHPASAPSPCSSAAPTHAWPQR